MDITAGMLDKRVKFESPVNPPSGTIGQTGTYEEWMRTWAHVRPISGSRSFNEGYSAALTRYDIWVRWRQEISNNLMKESRIIYDNRKCMIDSVFVEGELTDRYFHFAVTEKH